MLAHKLPILLKKIIHRFLFLSLVFFDTWIKTNFYIIKNLFIRHNLIYYKAYNDLQLSCSSKQNTYFYY